MTSSSSDLYHRRRRRSSRPASQVDRPANPTPDASQRNTPTPTHDEPNLASASAAKRRSQGAASIGLGLGHAPPATATAASPSPPTPSSKSVARRSSVGKRPVAAVPASAAGRHARRRSGVPSSASASAAAASSSAPPANMAASNAAARTPVTPPAPSLSATYMPSEADFLGETWVGTPSARSNMPDRSPNPEHSMGSPDRNRTTTPRPNAPPPRPATHESPRRNETSSGRTERDPTASNATEGDERDRERRQHRHKKAPSQKAMLARALEKANHAVVLDNAQNYEQAMTAYHDACNLLHQVMVRTSGEEDKNKLDAIRKTYKVRIHELENNELANLQPSGSNEKALPDVPRSLTNSVDMSAQSVVEEAVDTTHPTTGQLQVQPSADNDTRLHPRAASREKLPPRRQSLSPQTTPLLASEGRRVSPERRTPTMEEPRASSPRKATTDPVDEPRAPSPRKTSAPVVEAQKPSGEARNLSVPMDKKYVPAPLSPRRMDEPMTLPSIDASHGEDAARPETATNATPTLVPATATATATAAAVAPAPKEPQPARIGHLRTNTAGSTSWLDTIGESGASSSSSTRSRDSMDDMRGHFRQGSGATEAEFDSALDAAIEAAYDQGFEPMSDEEAYDQEPLTMATTLGSISDARRNVDLARQAVQAAEREAAIAAAKDRERRRRLENPWPPREVAGNPHSDIDYDDMKPEDEERILEEMTKDYIMEDSRQSGSSKPSLPRQSDASTFSARTWGTSVGSVPSLGSSQLPTVNEAPISALASAKKSSFPSQPATLPGPPQVQMQEPAPPPPIPKQGPPEPPSANILSPGVRERRLSGQKAKTLKIDTTTRPSAGGAGAQTHPVGHMTVPNQAGDLPRSATFPREHLDGAQQSAHLLQSGPRTISPYAGHSPEPSSNARDAVGTTRDPLEHRSTTPASPGRARSTLKKNFSSSSLKSAKSTDDLPGTPLGRVFSSTSRKETIPNMPDLPVAAPHNFTRSMATGSMSFFDNDMHSPDAPGSPNPFYANAPIPLEPCPEIATLRPFWLMRCLYQTIAHPRGGYLSRRLFIPRDIWRVKNVKLRNVDDKVAQLDLLTAGLMNLSKVDTLDADAVLEVMQSFELLLDQVQGTLTKKLGSEVGVQGSSAMFKGSPVVDDGTMPDPMSAKDKKQGYFSGLRKLRNKSSAGPGSGLMAGASGKDGGRGDAHTLKSLPMTPLMNVKFVKRDPTKILGIGPNAHYMAALARLCDAAQVIDQIARQVEDPGLKFSSTAHVGLELSTKHAAEFFGFYVCRFALADLGMMLDKFIKRGSEWVMG